MIVMKFGGTSVESEDAIATIARIVRHERPSLDIRGGLGHGKNHKQAA